MHRRVLFSTVCTAALLLGLLSGCGGQVAVSVSTLTPSSPLAATQPPPSTPVPAVEATQPPAATIPATQPPSTTTSAGQAATPGPVASSVAAPGEQLLEQWAVSASASSEYDNPDWAAFQAVGQPDTLVCDDLETAWAAGASDSVEWLELRYAIPVRPTEVRIVQSYEPDQVVRVELLDIAGVAHEVYASSAREVETCPYVLSVPVQASYLAAAVRVTVDQQGREDWNEIDAVQLLGWALAGGPTVALPVPGEEIRQWGVTAQAGSEYGSSDFAAIQAIGAPNTRECGDWETAWAAAAASTVEWLQVHYAIPVRPTQVNVVQSYNPGQVVRVELLDTAGNYHEIYAAAPRAEGTCPYTLSIAVADAAYQAIAVRVTVDQALVSDWTEIDAVELVGRAGL